MSFIGRPGGQHDPSNPHLHVFFNWVQENLLPTQQDLKNGLRPFLPTDSLRAYFQSHNEYHLRKLLDVEFGEDPDLVRAEEILSSGSETIFTILLYMGRARFIREFLRVGLRDSKLPFDPKYPPSHFPHDTSNPRFYADFCDAQWRFCATRIEYWSNRELHGEEILPFTRKEKLAKGATATIYKVSLHQHYNGLSGRPCDLVVKTFDDRDASTNATNYETEAKMYRKIQHGDRNVPNVTKFFAAFQQGETYNLLLEYAEKDSLQKFRDQLSPPSTQIQIDKLWASHFGLLRALKDLQHHDEDVWHQDIKPPNVLVFSSSQDASDEYDFILKLADFGNSHSEKRHSNLQNGSSSSQDSRGTKTYGSPECYRPESVLGEGRLKVPLKVDIWSVGCIFSETAVLICYGKDGLESYAEARRKELRQTPGFENSDCFHNGQHLLTTVEEFHEEMREACKIRGDTTTLKVLDMIDHMLAPLEHRWDSQELCKQAHIIADASLCSPKDFGIVGATNLDINTSHEQGTAGKRSSPSFSPYGTKHSSIPSRPSLRVTGDEDVRRHSPSASTPEARRAVGQGNAHEGSVHTGKRVISDPTLGSKAADLGHFRTAIPIIQREPDHGFAQNRDSLAPISDPVRQEGSSRSEPHHPVLHQLTTANSFSASPGPSRPVALEKSALSSPLASPISPQELAEANEKRLMIGEAELWMKRKKGLSITEKARGKTVHLRGEIRLDALNKRDSVIVIDDSATMDKHRADLLRLLQVFIYMIKKSDENGIDLWFARDLKTYNLKHASDIVEKVEQQRFDEQCDIRRVLGEVLYPWCDKLREQKRALSSRQVKPLNVYVFTDANWTDESKVAPLIEYVVDTLTEVHRREDRIGIQFISFGTNEQWLEKLDELDDDLGLRFDIVDTKPSDGCLYEMILGAIQKGIDRLKRSPSATPQPHYLPVSGIRSR